MSEFIEIDYSGLRKVADAFRTAPQIAREEMDAAMTEAVMLLEREVKEATPTTHGILRASIFGVSRATDSGVLGLVASPLNYAEAVELGTKPHFPPLAPLMDWVVQKLGVPFQDVRSVAFLIARKISRKGTTGAFMFTKTYARQEAAVKVMFERALERFARRVERMGTQ